MTLENDKALSYHARKRRYSMQKDVTLQGFTVEVRKDLEIPPALLEFLLQDDQGIYGLEFMLKDPSLCTKIPDDVRYTYEILYNHLSISLSDEISNAIDFLNKIEKNPQTYIHSIMQTLYEKHKNG